MDTTAGLIMAREHSPAMISELLAVHHAACAAGHGEKESIYDDACKRIGVSRRTLTRYLKQVVVRPERKQRSDAGEISLSREEAALISAVLMDSLRKTNKRLYPIGDAVEILRKNGKIRAERIDADTGEILPLSTAAISRALRVYGLHPDQLLQPAPHTELQSLHPNHVWQIDASLCVLYYLHAKTDRERGLQVMDRKKFYKNKPKNLDRIAADRVWSYEVTDHFSGAIFVTYVMGAESGANLAESFILATQQRGSDPFYGVPFILQMDMASANTGGAFGNLARRMSVDLYPHAAENARATGQVENARNIIERSFESGLRLQPVADLAELNAAARKWARWYNATKNHSRYGATRFEKWMEIQPQQLRTIDADLARALLTHTPESRKVSGTLTVSFAGNEYDVRDIPRVMVGEKLMVTYNPYTPGTAVIVDTDANGHELLHTVPLVERNGTGFRFDAPVIGEEYARLPDTLADTNRKEVERIAMDAATDEEAAEKRKRRVPSFGGRLDPAAVIDKANIPAYLPKRGTELTPDARTASAIPETVLSHYAAAGELIARGVALSPERNALIQQWYPDGVPETELDNLQRRLETRDTLRVVGGKG